MVKVIRQGIVDDLVKELGNDLPKFLLHCFVKREQSKEFEEEKAKVKKGGFAALQVDFTENFTADIRMTYTQHTGIRNRYLCSLVWLGAIIVISHMPS